MNMDFLELYHRKSDESNNYTMANSFSQNDIVQSQSAHVYDIAKGSKSNISDSENNDEPYTKVNITADQNLTGHSTSTDHECSNDDHASDDYEMLSISSWDINLSASGDDDALESEEDCGSMVHEVPSETITLENSPNVMCCSAKTPVKSFDTSQFFQRVFLKRRNAVRHECKPSKRRPTWDFHRPDSDRCLHNKILPDDDCPDADASDRGVTIDFFVGSYNHSIFSTLDEFRNNLTYGVTPQFTAYSNPLNVAKNRYSDIPCIEESRVKLVRDICPTNLTDHDQDRVDPSVIPTDYIHANWVDGYRQKNAFICTQGPMISTVCDFWHMVMQYRAPIIVMTTRPREQNRDKCFQYWPEKVDDTLVIPGITDRYDSFEITCLRSKEFGANCPKKGVCDKANEHWYKVALLHVKNCRTGLEHRVNHFYFHSWPDQGIPRSTEGFLQFILQIRRTYIINISKLEYESEMDQAVPPPPIVVHCSAGIGRTGTYVVTDICTKSLSDCGRFNIYQTMSKVRSQRYKSIQNAYQYIYCRNTIIDYARHFGMLDSHTFNSSDEEKEDSQDEEFEEDENEEEEEEEEKMDQNDNNANIEQEENQDDRGEETGNAVKSEKEGHRLTEEPEEDNIPKRN